MWESAWDHPRRFGQARHRHSQVLAITAYFAGDRSCTADGNGEGCGSLRWAAVAMRKQLAPR